MFYAPVFTIKSENPDAITSAVHNVTIPFSVAEHLQAICISHIKNIKDGYFNVEEEYYNNLIEAFDSLNNPINISM